MTRDSLLQIADKLAAGRVLTARERADLVAYLRRELAKKKSGPKPQKDFLRIAMALVTKGNRRKADVATDLGFGSERSLDKRVSPSFVKAMRRGFREPNPEQFTAEDEMSPKQFKSAVRRITEAMKKRP